MQKPSQNNTGRIGKTRDLQRVYRIGKTIHANTLVIKFVLKKDYPSRIAFVISKKVSKRAVIRNKIRRVLREELRTKILPGLPAGDYVIMVKTRAAESENSDLRIDLNLAAQKIFKGNSYNPK